MTYSKICFMYLSLHTLTLPRKVYDALVLEAGSEAGMSEQQPHKIVYEA